MIEILLSLQDQLLSPSNLFVIIGLLLILSELFVGIETGLDFVLIGSILIISGFTGTIFGNVWITIIAAIILSIIYFTYGRKIVKSRLIFNQHSTNIDKLIDQTAIVTKAISKHQPGQVKIHDENWRAKADRSFKEGQEVTIDSVVGVTVTVKPLNKH